MHVLLEEIIRLLLISRQHHAASGLMTSEAQAVLPVLSKTDRLDSALIPLRSWSRRRPCQPGL